MAPVREPSGPRAAVQTRRGVFGELDDGTLIEQVELTCAAGVRACVMTLGASLQAFETPDRHGRSADIVLGHDRPQPYLDKRQYFGATVGRFANRIARGVFSVNGRRFELPCNDGINSLHGGRTGFDRRIWNIAKVERSPGAGAAVTFSLLSPDGEEGYPGTLEVEATYTLTAQGELKIDYRAECDQPTIVNLTNHSYFNLSGALSGEDMMQARLTIDADAYTPVDDTLIPTGEIRCVEGGPFDFREAAPVGPRLREGRDAQIRLAQGVDHNFVLNGEAGALKRAARIEDPRSGRVLELFTTAPGLQLYTGNGFDGTAAGKGERLYRQGDALVLEPQIFPNAPNTPTFPSARLDPRQTYRNQVVYRVSVPAV
jgi:aldose 1-epimerase